MYENLLILPYFQGMSKDELTGILDKVKFEFTQYTANDKIATHGAECNRFVILIQGSIKIVSTADNHKYRIEERAQAPYAIEPYSLFGGKPQYQRSYYAQSNCSILSIDKSYFYSEFFKHQIFSINLLNLISRKIQITNDTIWNKMPCSIEGSIVRFIALRSELSGGEKWIYIKMEDLADMLQETRLNISKALNNMQEQGLVTLSRKEIYIPSFNKLSMAMSVL
ncbi:MAG: Crp/Fnr family transcriptional regulator [Bacteroidales bacterium]|nr:Crp/Fnr family transcriptional regulator [Bacteroidales bacterium]